MRMTRLRSFPTTGFLRTGQNAGGPQPGDLQTMLQGSVRRSMRGGRFRDAVSYMHTVSLFLISVSSCICLLQFSTKRNSVVTISTLFVHHPLETAIFADYISHSLSATWDEARARLERATLTSDLSGPESRPSYP